MSLINGMKFGDNGLLVYCQPGLNVQSFICSGFLCQCVDHDFHNLLRMYPTVSERSQRSEIQKPWEIQHGINNIFQHSFVEFGKREVMMECPEVCSRNLERTL